jgi:hypothetical protein
MLILWPGHPVVDIGLPVHADFMYYYLLSRVTRALNKQQFPASELISPCCVPICWIYFICRICWICWICLFRCALRTF